MTEVKQALERVLQFYDKLERQHAPGEAKLLDEVSAVLSSDAAQRQQEPVVWASFTERGYVRFWTTDKTRAVAEMAAGTFNVKPYTVDDLMGMVVRASAAQPPAAPVETDAEMYRLRDLIAGHIACEEDCKKMPSGCGCALTAARAIVNAPPARCSAGNERADYTCYVERSKVRQILIEQPDVAAETTSYILHDIDQLPIFTAEDFRVLPQRSAATSEAGDPIRWIKDTYLMWLKGDLDPAHMRLGQHFFRAQPQVAPTQTFYGARCPSYPNCSGGCGLGCIHEMELEK